MLMELITNKYFWYGVATLIVMAFISCELYTWIPPRNNGIISDKEKGDRVRQYMDEVRTGQYQ